jgi:hypothetical protein
MALTAHASDKKGKEAEAKRLLAEIKEMGGKPKGKPSLQTLKGMYSKLVAEVEAEEKARSKK